MAKTAGNAETAIGPMVIVAMEQYVPQSRRIVDDPLAIRMLPGSAAALVSLCRWAPLRNLLISLSERAAPGAWGGMLGRKRYLDDITRRFVKNAAMPVVILGAGLDTKAIRLAIPAGVDAFEIDQPSNIALKGRALARALGEIPEALHLIPVDFETGGLAEDLAKAGFDQTRPALFIWEGVTQYLTKGAMERTMEFLSKAARGSQLAFTFVLDDFISGRDMHGSEAIYRRLVKGRAVWHFGMAADEVPGFLAKYGWDQREQAGAEEYRRNYFDPAGRSIEVMEIERAVLAEKVRGASRIDRSAHHRGPAISSSLLT